MTFDELSQWLGDYVAAYPETHRQRAIWRAPIVACAPADERFLRLKEITVADHALPTDLLADVRSVVVWFIPFKRHIQRRYLDG